MGVGSNFNKINCKQTVRMLIRFFTASDVNHHCLPISNKKEARLVWFKIEHI